MSRFWRICWRTVRYLIFFVAIVGVAGLLIKGLDRLIGPVPTVISVGTIGLIALCALNAWADEPEPK